MKKNNQGFIQIILILGVMILVGVAYFFGTQKIDSNTKITLPTPTPASSETSVKLDTANWKTYTNSKMKLYMKYPNGKSLQIFTSQNNDLNFALNIEQYAPLFLEVALLPNTTVEKWYEMSYSSAKQESEIRPVLMNGPVIDKNPSFYSDFVQQGSGFVRQIYVQTGNDLYQIVIPAGDNSLQYQILSTFKFTK